MKIKKQKQKTRKSFFKRFRITKKGKVLFRGSHIRHLRRKKGKANIRRQKIPQKIQKSLAKKIKRLIGK